jgi:retron-type reverse transcriptase
VHKIKIKKSSTDKTSRGYRLKNSTHRLIDKIRKMMNANQDIVITKACEMLYNEFKPGKK